MSQKFTTDHLGNRMKKYEKVSQNYLINRMPVIIRVDGRAFHNFTKQFEDNPPFSHYFNSCMNETAKYLLKNIAGAQFAYVQSDEISILLNNWTNLTTEPWFDNNVQKLTSISASLATAKFNQLANFDTKNTVDKLFFYVDDGEVLENGPTKDNMKELMNEHKNSLSIDRNIDKIRGLATFDSRVFNLSKEEVENYFIWRQNDCERNSVFKYAKYFFSAKSLQNKNKETMLKQLTKKGVAWKKLDDWKKYGSIVYRDLIDTDSFLFKENRSFIHHYLKDSTGVIW